MRHEELKSAGGKGKELWRRMISESIEDPFDLPASLCAGQDELERVTSLFPMRINPYYLALIQNKGDPIYRQCVPDLKELNDEGLDDPLLEEGHSPVPGLTHRYPDRVLFLVSNRCAVYCRFCNRRRKVGRPGVVSNETIREGLSYIRGHKEIRDVLLSGGDPFLLEDEELGRILSEIRSISHVEVVRIGTRVPCTLPHRVTKDLARILKKFNPLYIHTHFNHPRELTRATVRACGRLADAGIPLGCQTVLLKGINDDPYIIRELMQGLLKIRVRPYYLFQADLAKGTSHFWTPLQTGLDIMRFLQGHTSGMCLPHFAVDLPGGGGKVPFLPEYIVEKRDNDIVLKTYEGKTYSYPLNVCMERRLE
ncbi:MAG: KamA family radical SAM protein [Desulfobacteraceae bacterium]|nr:MAG: KamA family radical SAM protein [Desulfobacteraceae bacterium]